MGEVSLEVRFALEDVPGLEAVLGGKDGVVVFFQGFCSIRRVTGWSSAMSIFRIMSFSVIVYYWGAGVINFPNHSGGG